jgi:hypothetical protein
MSSEVFWWEPHHDNRTIGEQFRTITTEYESGVEQRRNRWHRGRMGMHYSFNRFVDQDFDSVLQFYQARKGSYDDFYLPLWDYTSYLTQAAAGSTVYIANKTQFSVTGGVRGNAIFFREQGALEPDNEVATILSFGGGNAVNLNSSLTYSYASGADVFVAVKARFVEDVMEKAYYSKTLYKLDLDFIEVK